jgi:hypothetical protein
MMALTRGCSPVLRQHGARIDEKTAVLNAANDRRIVLAQGGGQGLHVGVGDGDQARGQGGSGQTAAAYGGFAGDGLGGDALLLQLRAQVSAVSLMVVNERLIMRQTGISSSASSLR